MFYTIKLKILKFLKSPAVKLALRNLLKIKSGDDIRKELIKKYVPGKSFADIGCMWRVKGSFSFLAEEYSAKRILAVDINEDEMFWNEKNKRNSKVEFIKGDIHLKETIDKIGSCDVIFCSGVLYHSPNPIALISQLRKICKETLILATMVIPEIPFIKNTAIFYPYLNKKQRNLWKLNGIQKGIKEPCETNNKYANWFWGFSPTCVESMLKYSQFNIEKRYIRPFQAFYVCKAE